MKSFKYFGSTLVGRPLLRALAAAVLAGFCLLVPASSASALTGPQLLTFEDLPTETEVSTQYEGQGVVFKDEDGFYPEVSWDEAAWTNPVLSGAFGFGSPIGAEFVEPATPTAAAVENLALEVGFIDDPGSTRVVVDRADGSEAVLTADEFGFNRLEEPGGGITGFQVESIGEEEAGWTIDNLEYTIPAPPPPPPATPRNGCAGHHHRNLLHRVIAGLRCKSRTFGKCLIAIAIDFPELRGAKLVSGLYDLKKVSKALKPIAKLYNDLKKVKLLPDAPKGYRTFGEIKRKLEHVHRVLDVVKMIPDLVRAIPKREIGVIVNDLIDLAGVRPCIDLIAG